jgi:outer membrane protein OmpA-like peptidoglycan-associated protein
MGPNVNDPKQWDSQPSVTPDGSKLYFASARDSLSGIDIYVTQKKEDGTWARAKKLSPVINTNGNDKSPFIHLDCKTLYFSSDSLPGLGGYDIFMSTLDDKGNWSTPMNLGYPINTEEDEVGFFVSTDGTNAYFSSNRFAGGGYDIYSFELYNKARPEAMNTIKGFVTGDNGEGPIAPIIEIRDVVTQEMQKIEVDKVSGEYAFIASRGHDQLMTIKKPDYAYESKYISAKDSTPPIAVKQHIELKNVEVGKQYTLNDVYFATNSFVINTTTKIILDDFAKYLKETPRMRVAINGHTDNVGNDQDNMVLSENRAKTIYEYLLSQNIDKARLSYKGFGATKPISSNSTEDGRARNRRTVFVVTAK